MVYILVSILIISLSLSMDPSLPLTQTKLKKHIHRQAQGHTHTKTGTENVKVCEEFALCSPGEYGDECTLMGLVDIMRAHIVVHKVGCMPLVMMPFGEGSADVERIDIALIGQFHYDMVEQEFGGGPKTNPPIIKLGRRVGMGAGGQAGGPIGRRKAGRQPCSINLTEPNVQTLTIQFPGSPLRRPRR